MHIARAVDAAPLLPPSPSFPFPPFPFYTWCSVRRATLYYRARKAFRAHFDHPIERSESSVMLTRAEAHNIVRHVMCESNYYQTNRWHRTHTRTHARTRAHTE